MDGVTPRGSIPSSTAKYPDSSIGKNDPKTAGLLYEGF
jgi:hypothetical protein